MTTIVLEPASAAVGSRKRAAARPAFFSVMSVALLLLVLSGFTPTLYLRPLFNPPAIPGYLFLHGITLTAWFVWLCVQTLLIQSRRAALHRRLGVAGGVLAAIVPFAGLMATNGALGRLTASGLDLNADASVLGIGVNGISLLEFASGVVWGNIASAISFAVLAWTGILLRRRTAAHKRLMLLATVAILGPALARLARLPYFGGEGGPFVVIVSLTLLGIVVVHDVVTTRKVHPATVFGAAFPLVLFAGATAISTTAFGLDFVRRLQ
jgi:hypothetical protein